MCATACVYWWCSHSVAIDNHKAYYYMTCRFSITLDSLSLIAVFENKFSHEMLVGWMQSILSSCYLFVWFAFELWSVLCVVDSRVDCCKQFKFEYLCLFFFFSCSSTMNGTRAKKANIFQRWTRPLVRSLPRSKRQAKRMWILLWLPPAKHLREYNTFWPVWMRDIERINFAFNHTQIRVTVASHGCFRTRTFDQQAGRFNRTRCRVSCCKCAPLDTKYVFITIST